MSTANGANVLAIGIDAAESTLVRQLIEQDELPALKSLLADGRWLRVQSPAHIGSGAVWPTFMTGAEFSGWLTWRGAGNAGEVPSVLRVRALSVSVCGELCGDAC